MRLTEKQINLLGKQVLIKTKTGEQVAKIRVLMDPTPVLFLRESSSKQTWSFNPENLIPISDKQGVDFTCQEGLGSF